MGSAVVAAENPPLTGGTSFPAQAHPLSPTSNKHLGFAFSKSFMSLQFMLRLKGSYSFVFIQGKEF